MSEKKIDSTVEDLKEVEDEQKVVVVVAVMGRKTRHSANFATASHANHVKS